ncbi:DUF2330 domain-containing protein [Ammoniphilus resinae]|uniref:DUF2330 domain-containing protein n=1 Tax=Ammoniphilus resinae TaxID=861532 RepID=A0ABS4GLP2_9BACL|nr:DUF2330 domain-containing protein [Ammoniphilus resinae]MBP1931185.1 hypothetical protein [Ammoniphilus resinae]
MKIWMGIFISFFIWANQAVACGVLVSDSETNVRSEHMLAALYWDQSNRSEILAVKMSYQVNEGKVNSFGWVMPFPSPPKIEEASWALFESLGRVTEYKKNLKEKASLPRFPGTTGNKEGSPAGSGVSVIQEKQVGIYRTVTIQAKDTQSLKVWAKENKFTLPWVDSLVIENYIQKGWYFVLMDVENVGEQKEEGEIKPVEFTFKTEKPVYPIQIAAFNREGGLSPQKTIPLTLYLIGKERLAPDSTFRTLLTQRYGGELIKQETVNRTLAGGKSDIYVSKWDGILQADQIQDDLMVVEDSNLKDVGSGKMTVMDYLSLLGTLLFGGTMFLFLIPQFMLAALFENPWLGKLLPVMISLLGFIWITAKFSFIRAVQTFLVLHAVGAFLLMLYYKDESLLMISQFVIVGGIFGGFIFEWYRRGNLNNGK